jgi:hypothetical protein
MVALTDEEKNAGMKADWKCGPVEKDSFIGGYRFNRTFSRAYWVNVVDVDVGESDNMGMYLCPAGGDPDKYATIPCEHKAGAVGKVALYTGSSPD